MRRGEVAKGSAWALVTGAGSGIGRCFALRLARLGYRLVLVGNDLRKLESVQAELRALDAAEVRVISCDLARAEAARELYERVRAAGIDVDVLINNAGIFSFRDILRTPAERIERVIMLHCLTATQLCRLFARDMAARNGFAANPEAEPRAVTDMATPATQTGERSDTQSVPAMPTDGRPGTQPAPRHAKRRFHILNMASYSLWMPFLEGLPEVLLGRLRQGGPRGGHPRDGRLPGRRGDQPLRPHAALAAHRAAAGRADFGRPLRTPRIVGPVARAALLGPRLVEPTVDTPLQTASDVRHSPHPELYHEIPKITAP